MMIISILIFVMNFLLFDTFGFLLFCNTFLTVTHTHTVVDAIWLQLTTAQTILSLANTLLFESQRTTYLSRESILLK